MIRIYVFLLLFGLVSCGKLLKTIDELERQVRSLHDDIYRSIDNTDDIDRSLKFDDDLEHTEYVVRVKGGADVAGLVAKDSGLRLIRELRTEPDLYIMRTEPILHLDRHQRSKREAQHHRDLMDHSQVDWAEQQRVRRRTKRDLNFNDPLWKDQWYVHDTRTDRREPKTDLHVPGAWKLGYTGKGVSVSILDDGLQKNHSDIMKNYNAAASWDLNDDDDDPTPRFDEENKHGTRCAGEVAMTANNSICGVGVAYDAGIAGVRILDGPVTDRLEAEALGERLQVTDVFSASWGPNDDGQTVEGPGPLAFAAMLKGVNEGRKGKGVIYVWASGNGGLVGDDCNCDGYTDSPYTLSISSASQHVDFPWYGEKCPSTLATTFSSSNPKTDANVATVDTGVDGLQCTTAHSGTSAAAPMAAGIVALILQANPALTWRDVQHIVVYTSEPAPLGSDDGWHINGRGLFANTKYGFGLMNAEAAVRAASTWTNVPELHICHTIIDSFKTGPVRFENGKAEIQLQTNACKGMQMEVNYLEALQVITDIDYHKRGNLAIWLKSPSGTLTKLLSPRNRDDSKKGFVKWPFMSVHTWGEKPQGIWSLRIYDRVADRWSDGLVNNISLVLYGTKDKPAHYDKDRSYDWAYNNIHDKRAESRAQYYAAQAREIAQALHDLKIDKSDERRRNLARAQQALDYIEAHHDLRYRQFDNYDY